MLSQFTSWGPTGGEKMPHKAFVWSCQLLSQVRGCKNHLYRLVKSLSLFVCLPGTLTPSHSKLLPCWNMEFREAQICVPGLRPLLFWLKNKLSSSPLRWELCFTMYKKYWICLFFIKYYKTCVEDEGLKSFYLPHLLRLEWKWFYPSYSVWHLFVQSPRNLMALNSDSLPSSFSFPVEHFGLANWKRLWRQTPANGEKPP